jgi:hypothetical protein
MSTYPFFGTVSNLALQVAIGTKAYWNGDNISAGLLGLAYPGLTSEFSGTTPNHDKFGKRIIYDPVFTRMYKDNLSAPMFSIALERNSGGYLAFGGIPAEVTPSGPFASTPITKMVNSVFGGAPNYYFYSIKPDALLYEGSSSTNTATYIVDSGTTLFYAPSKAAKQINALFDPPAKLKNGLYTVSCEPKASPAVGVKIGGTVFDINVADLILQDPTSGTCVSGVQDGGAGPYILGDVFMTNVIAVFDVGAAEMRFAANDY